MTLSGNDWEQAKTQTEVRPQDSTQSDNSVMKFIQCLDYLFELAVKMRLAGIPTEPQPA